MSGPPPTALSMHRQRPRICRVRRRSGCPRLPDRRRGVRSRDWRCEACTAVDGALQPETAEAAAVLRTERGYFATTADRIDYPTLAAKGLPIGSGAVESSAKHVVQHRMKRPGQRWSERGTRDMLALRARGASDHSLSLPG